MYFIPRNNAVYNYIAHTSAKRRYLATLFVGVIFIGVCFYGIYVPLHSHIFIQKAEIARLQKQYEEMGQLDKSSKDISSLLGITKQNIIEQALEGTKKEEHCHKQTLFVLDIITQLKLTLHNYGSCREKDKAWYTKDSANFEVTGSLEKIISFFKMIQDSKQMVTISQVVLTRVRDDIFKLGCDIGFIVVKK